MITPINYLIYIGILVLAGAYGAHRVAKKEAKQRRWERKIIARKKLWK